MERRRVGAGSPWGDVVCYSRAVKVGNLVFVAGTTASGTDGAALHPGDPGKQAEVALQRIEAALRQLGASLDDVVETRVYVRDIAQWPAVGRAHGAAFGQARPAATMVAVSSLIAPDLLVEISAIAVLDDPRQ